MACKFTITQSESQLLPLAVIMGAYQWCCAEEEIRNKKQSDTENLHTITMVGDSLLMSMVYLPQIALATQPPVEDWLKFQGLVTKWHEERGATSSITEMALCPSYQTIIGMGPAVIPFILAQLESEGDEPDHWFWALRALTGENPVGDEDRGNSLRMAQSWLQWAKSKDYAW